MAMGATGPVMRAISRRRSHRQQWAVFEIIAMLILDTWLVRIAFDLAYDVRFNLIPQNTFLNTILNYIHTNLAENASHAKGGIGIPPPGNFELLRISITIGLVAIFAFFWKNFFQTTNGRFKRNGRTDKYNNCSRNGQPIFGGVCRNASPLKRATNKS